METTNLLPGTRIKLVSSRPIGWNALGLMDKFLGATVTFLRYTNPFQQNFRISEDGAWVFKTTDIFEIIGHSEDTPLIFN